MILPDPPQPKYWKALIPSAVLFGFAGWLFRPLFPHVPAALWWSIFAACAMLLAYTVHRKMQYDREANWVMNFTQTDRATYVPPVIKVKDK